MKRRQWAAYGVLGAVLCLTVAGDTEAGLFRQRTRFKATTAYRVRGVTTQSPPGCAGGTCTVPAPVFAVPQASVSGDGAAFLGWLNGVRASYGLGPVGYDPNLASWAAQNNAAQQARGLGHHVMGPARRQNSAVGGYGSLSSMWMGSPAHRAALLDPTITRAAVVGNGAYWTFNAS